MVSATLNSVSTKILGLVGFVCLATITVATIGILTMKDIGTELTSIAENDIPLTKNVNAVTAHQLEQSILLERMLRLGGIQVEVTDERLKQLEDRIVELTGTVKSELKESEEIAAEALRHSTIAEEREEIRLTLERLKAIETDYVSFDTHIREIIEVINDGKADGASQLAEMLVEEEKRFAKSLTDMATELDAFTANAARSAEEHEIAGTRNLMIISILSILIGAAGAWLFARIKISQPLQSVATALGRLTAGDMTIELNIKSRDEIGLVADAYEKFKITLIEIERLRQEAIEEEQRIEQEKRDATLRLADELERTVKSVSDSVADAVRDLEQTAAGIAANSVQTSDRANTVAAAAEQSSVSIQSVAGAAEELNSSIQEISRQVTDALTITNSTSDQARASTETVENLTSAAQRIDDVVSLINDIAGQTNLLALNATIEAARAGEAGKGFAVVASEVKALATQTAKATEDIRNQVEELQAGSNYTRNAMLKVMEAISQMDQQIAGISAAVEEQTAVTSEISRNVTEVASGSTNISENIKDVSMGASSASAASEELRATVASLASQSDMLNSQLDAFLLNIRAA
ncbi:methyl-accepting chemotaxis protein [Roseibium suaedae]|uniref:Methyl-accepting chemotaxis protein n=1 Tax=Roseibium suaedae TaxID=735517 RepID=A0A1M7H6M7_9HYPH|nr:methyl-accepting chemotaxis protein [Roseibium suaedae]SHM24155.1 methyl-accepting chemotaxis protein [Roseibium suaedae]